MCRSAPVYHPGKPTRRGDVYLKKTSATLKGKTIDLAVIQETIEIMHSEIAPISDARGSKEYKALLLEQLLKAHFRALVPEVGEEIFKQ